MSSPRTADGAERSVLGEVLLNGVDALDLLQEAGLRAEHFYHPAHEALYRAMQRLGSRGSQIDARLLAGSLSPEEKRSIGDPHIMAELVTEGCGTPLLDSHAAQIIDASVLRELATRAVKIAYVAETVPLDQSREALERARAELDLVEVPQEAESLAAAREIFVELIDEMETERPRGVSTGFYDLDYLLGGGLGKGQTIVIGARPSVGKSMLGINLAANAARKGIPTIIFSHEMTRSELMQRIVARETGVPLTRIRSGRMRDEDWDRISRAHGIIQQWPLYIDDESSMTVADYRSRLRKLRKRSRIGLVVADYIQLVKPFDVRVSREQQVAGISAAAKALAKDFAMPVILLAQLSRQTEQRKDARPVMSDLRESGAIENDADVVALMHELPSGYMEVNIVKNRQGERGSVELVWNPRIMRAEPQSRGG